MLMWKEGHKLHTWPLRRMRRRFFLHLRDPVWQEGIFEEKQKPDPQNLPDAGKTALRHPPTGGYFRKKH
jgi:hypothetical protein